MINGEDKLSALCGQFCHPKPYEWHGYVSIHGARPPGPVKSNLPSIFGKNVTCPGREKVNQHFLVQTIYIKLYVT